MPISTHGSISFTPFSLLCTVKRAIIREVLKLIVNLNGQYWFDTEKTNDFNDICVIKKSNKLKAFALSLWTGSGILFANQHAHAGSFYDSMKPLTETFQDIALGMAIIFSLAGFILLGFRRRWGETTLKTTAVVVIGVFLVPSILMLIAIVGTMLNDALGDAFHSVRAVPGQ